MRQLALETFYLREAILNKDVQELLKVQELDRKIVKLNEEVENLHEQEKEKETEVKLQTNNVETLHKEIEELLEDKNFKDELLDENVEILKRLEEKTKIVTTEKQLSAINTEIEIAKTNKDMLEEKLLGIIVSIEEKEKNVKEIEASLKQVQEEMDKFKQTVKKKTDQIKKNIDEIEKRKKTLYKNINLNTIKRYEELNRWTKGTSIVPVKQGACYGCFMKITPQTLTTVKETDEIVFCPNCGRILYYPDDEK
jgi:hypothetical protein